MRTGLKGEWTGEKMIGPKVVKLVAERCRLLVHIDVFFSTISKHLKLIQFWSPMILSRDGLKEVKTTEGGEEWGKDGSMDPQEKKQV